MTVTISVVSLSAPTSVSCATISGSLPTDTYYFTIIGLTSNMISPPNSEVTHTLASSGGIRVTWASVPGAGNYHISYRKSAEDWYGDRRAASTGGATTWDVTTDSRDTGIHSLHCENPQHFPAGLDNESGAPDIQISSSGTFYLKDIYDAIVTAYGNDNVCKFAGTQTGPCSLWLLGNVRFIAPTTAVLDCTAGMYLWLFGRFVSGNTDALLIGTADCDEGTSSRIDLAKSAGAITTASAWVWYNICLSNWGISHWTDGLAYATSGGISTYCGGTYKLCIFDNFRNTFQVPTVENTLFIGGEHCLQPSMNMADYGFDGSIFYGGTAILMSNMMQNYKFDNFTWEDDHDFDMEINWLFFGGFNVDLRNPKNNRPGRTENKPRCNYAQYLFPIARFINIQYSVDVKVVDEDGNAIQTATVKMWDKDDNLLFTQTTDSDGEIAQQTVTAITMQPNSTGIDDANYSKSTIAYKTPMKMEVSKAGYETYTMAGIVPSEKIDWIVGLSNYGKGTGSKSFKLIGRTEGTKSRGLL